MSSGASLELLDDVTDCGSAAGVGWLHKRLPLCLGLNLNFINKDVFSPKILNVSITIYSWILNITEILLNKFWDVTKQTQCKNL